MIKKWSFILGISMLALAACTSDSSSGGSSLSVDEGQAAITAVDVAGNAAFDEIEDGSYVDLGSTATWGNLSNLADTYEIGYSIPTSTFPKKRTYTFKGLRDSDSGYTIGGTFSVVWNNASDNTCALNLTFSGSGLPVKSITGDLTQDPSGSVAAGTIVFNGLDEFDIGQFTQHFFSH